MLDTHEIEKYSIRITEHVEGGVNWMDRVINLKLIPLAHGLEPDVFLHFDSFYDHMVGTLVKRNIFNAGIYIGLNPSRFEPIYAALRSEKPVYFTYEVPVDWADPFEKAERIDLSRFSIHTGLEPVGEVERPQSISGLRIQAEFSELRKRLNP